MNQATGTILIVDDTKLNLEIMKALLQSEYAILTASNGLEGLHLAQTEKIDLILLDVNMPGIDGFETCARLKADPATENIPVIFVTARDEVAEETKGLALGAIDYIIKPISAPIVRARVHNHMRMKQYQDRLAQLTELELFRQTFELAAVGIVHVAPDGRWLRVNRKLSEILGYSYSELLQLTFQDITHPDDLDIDLQFAQKLLDGSLSSYEMNKRYIDKLGKTIWANLTCSLVRDADGNPVYFIAIVEDISESKRLELELSAYKNHLEQLVAERTEKLLLADASIRQLSAAVEQSPVSVVITDTGGNISYINPKFAELTGYTADELYGKNPRILKSSETPAATYADMWQKLSSGKTWRGEFCNKKKNGELYWESASIKPLIDEKGHITHYVGVKADITQRKQTEAKLRELSLTDELTGLTNRRGFTILAEQQIKLSQRLQQGFAIFFADMDGMKGINDQLGHAVGDQALQEMAKILKESFRASDIVARLGGDEFACLSVDAGTADIAANLARLQQNITESNQKVLRPYTLSLSIGAASYDPANPVDLETLLAEADKQMYLAKKAKNGIRGN